MTAQDRLIVALDCSTVDEARRLVNELEGTVRFFKIGLVMQLAEGVEDFIRTLIREGKQVFLDYKYYDIGETLKKAVARATRLGVSFLTIHGPSRLIHAAVEGRGDSSLKLFAVTVLTSLDSGDMAELGVTQYSIEELVVMRARKALEAGCDGVIASGLEAANIKAACGGKLLVVTPGIRPAGAAAGDQKRITTPGDAIRDGADYLVVGRPITAPERGRPRQAAEAIVAEVQSAFDALRNPQQT
jgi:orotidine-5'-phosphate decarboxylase